MTTLDNITLAHVAGGAARGQSSEQRRERYKNNCTGPNARAQYDWMGAHMVPDSSEAPGVKRRVVKSISQQCGWPMPTPPAAAE
jgi:hypothetical protein